MRVYIKEKKSQNYISKESFKWYLVSMYSATVWQTFPENCIVSVCHTSVYNIIP